MASTTPDPENLDSVEFIREDDGTVTAKDLETGLARGDASRSEALAQLAEVLKLHEGAGDSIDNPDEFLQEELGIDPDAAEEEDLPDFLR